MRKTALYETHISHEGKMVEFVGWEMPLQYPTGIMEEHLLTRKKAGLFDISHMGRFIIRGNNALSFLQHVLTNNSSGLIVGKAQYTMIPNERGGAIDDAYLYRFFEDQYLLVVNAANLQKDWYHFQKILSSFSEVELIDQTESLAMLSLQGSLSREILNVILDKGYLPEPGKNFLSVTEVKGREVLIARTGYAGESLGQAFLGGGHEK
ncbi:Aminomethyltransferase [subsurface metagenome]